MHVVVGAITVIVDWAEPAEGTVTVGGLNDD